MQVGVGGWVEVHAGRCGRVGVGGWVWEDGLR